MRRMLFFAILLTAMNAGLFFGWSCSVIPGLARVPDPVYVHTMWSINRAIQNPLFLLVFVGAAVVLPLAAWQEFRAVGAFRSAPVVAATALYLLGTFGVTMLGNVPLNNMLDQVDPALASAERITSVRMAFEQPWVRLHSLRTVASVLALALLLWYVVRPQSVVDQHPMMP